jgi:hypothetical protein
VREPAGAFVLDGDEVSCSGGGSYIVVWHGERCHALVIRVIRRLSGEEAEGSRAGAGSVGCSLPAEPSVYRLSNRRDENEWDTIGYTEYELFAAKTFIFRHRLV